ncbi:MAG: hypothetical protein KTR21_12180 [Rhodobacteraceae bacterium]|nr:hypothetical protein [Paracoccaceae bacterium]
MFYRAFKAAVAVMVCAVSVAGCASVYAPSVGTEVVDRSYKLTGTRWRGSSDYTLIAIRAYERNGKTALCAAYGYVGDFIELPQVSMKLIEGSKLYYNDDPILVGMRFAARHDEVESMIGKMSNCIVTDVDWKPDYKDAQPELRRTGKIIYS